MTDAPDVGLAQEAADQADLAWLVSGSDEALGRIIRRWNSRLLGFAQRYLQDRASAEEAVAQAFVRLHEHRGRLRQNSRLSAWLFTTTANLCRNQLRWRKRHPYRPLEEAPQASVADARTPATHAADAERLELLRLALLALPHEDRTVILLSHYEGLSHREIAHVLETSEKSVESRLYRVRRELSESLRNR